MNNPRGASLVFKVGDNLNWEDRKIAMPRQIPLDEWTSLDYVTWRNKDGHNNMRLRINGDKFS